MKTLSTKKLAETVRRLREEKQLTQEELGKRTGINRIMISRMEREDFIPSMLQFEALADVLGFDFAEVFQEKDNEDAFIALRSEAVTENEREGVEKLFTMMLALRQQIRIRSSFENESGKA